MVVKKYSCSFCWLLTLLQDTLFDKLVGSGTTLQLLVEAVGPHVLFQALLVGSNAWGSVAFWKDVACIVVSMSQSQDRVIVRSTSSSLSGRFSRCFLKLSVCC